jgi:aspartate-semialdehyde dehydrogenase
MSEKIPVAVLGATGMVGRRFVELLVKHPWFEIVALCASDKSVGTPFGNHIIRPCLPDLPCSIVFSALDAQIAGPIEQAFADAGYFVVSNTRNHRMVPGVPLLVPEVNSKQLEWVRGKNGAIITNPNCSTIGLVLTLKPLYDRFGIEAVQVTTMQARSGAGAAGASLDLEDNVIPTISGEEEKIQTETLKILSDPSIRISAHCNRVNVSDGHLECVSVKFKREATREEVLQVWNDFSSLDLPTAPLKPIHYFNEENFPQPKYHRLLENGMAVSVGRLRPCPVFDFKYVLLSHNTIRGAAGGAILCGELLVKEGIVTTFEVVKR